MSKYPLTRGLAGSIFGGKIYRILNYYIPIKSGRCFLLICNCPQNAFFPSDNKKNYDLIPLKLFGIKY